MLDNEFWQRFDKLPPEEKEARLARLEAFLRQLCAERGNHCAKCPKRYGNMCPAAKHEICLN